MYFLRVAPISAAVPTQWPADDFTRDVCEASPSSSGKRRCFNVGLFLFLFLLFVLLSIVHVYSVCVCRLCAFVNTYQRGHCLNTHLPIGVSPRLVISPVWTESPVGYRTHTRGGVRVCVCMGHIAWLKLEVLREHRPPPNASVIE